MLYGWICWVGTKDLEKQMLTQSNRALFVLKPVFHFSDASLLPAVSPGSQALLHAALTGSRCQLGHKRTSLNSAHKVPAAAPVSPPPLSPAPSPVQRVRWGLRDPSLAAV